MNLELSNSTSAEGAAIGAAIGAILVYVAELATATDIPSALEGSILVVATYLVARLLPPRS